MSRAHSPTFPSLHLHHNSFSNPSVALPMSQLILQHFHCFTYIIAHSPTLLSLHLRHSSFSNPSLASPTSQTLHLIHLASCPCKLCLLTFENFWKSKNWFPVSLKHEFNPLLPELRKIFFNFFFDVILFRMGRKIYMIFSKSVIKRKLLYEGRERLARWIKWRACDVGEAREGLENELWHRWSNRRVGEWAVT